MRRFRQQPQKQPAIRGIFISIHGFSDSFFPSFLSVRKVVSGFCSTPHSASWMVFKTADVGKKLVSQMKQDPQNADLKLQLRDLQAKITALSERQVRAALRENTCCRISVLYELHKKVVEQLRRDLLVKQDDMKLQTLQADGQTSTLLIAQTQTPLPAASLTTPQSSVAPVIASKTLPLVLRAATPTSPIIMTPAPTITVVTTLGNTLLASPPSSDPQKSPVNFQPVIQTTNQGAEPVRVIPNSTVVVRPKPPASLSPAAGQVSVHTLQSPVLLSTALPSSGHVQQMRILNGLPCPNSSNNTSILISPSTHTQPSPQTHTQQLPHNSPSSDNTKLAFMLSLGLVTRDYLEEIQSRRQERKRRTTANPIYSGAMFEPEILQKEDAIEWPGTLAIVHSYISYKAAKEGEKDRLKRWSTELRQERDTLEQRIGQLSNSITRCMDSKNSVLAQQREMEASLEKMRGLVRLIRGIQLSPFICPGAMANGETPHNAASKPSSSSAITTDTNNNTNTPASSSEATLIISTLTNTSETLKQIAMNNNPEAIGASEESAQINSTSRIKSEPTNTNAAAFSNNSSSNQAVLSTNGTVSAGEENTRKHKTNSDLGVIPQALLGSIVPLTEVTEGVK
ncbi:PHD finger 21A-like isoform X3 [Labeo rohita]|uniref:PHD finger 21A-like isoform X3 n=1 Tax=Labeo rohita TaxID=84645 RepID=A0A498MJ10_LABRO|nr:PHD finger 21A-like isoform X3 [Labeo rohita]